MTPVTFAAIVCLIGTLQAARADECPLPHFLDLSRCGAHAPNSSECLVIAAMPLLHESTSAELLATACGVSSASLSLAPSECVELAQLVLRRAGGSTQLQTKLLTALTRQLDAKRCDWVSAALAARKRLPSPRWHWAVFALLLLIPCLVYGAWCKFLHGLSKSVTGLPTQLSDLATCRAAPGIISREPYPPPGESSVAADSLGALSAPSGAVVVPWGWCILGLGGVMPCVGLSFCLVTSLQYHFESVNDTHCHVPNVLPSISACIGDFAPQRYVWRGCIAAMIAQRVLDGFVLRSYYLRTITQTEWIQRRMRFFVPLHLGEHFGLLLLTCVSSTDSRLVGVPLHEAGFVMFVVCSLGRQSLVLSTFKLMIDQMARTTISQLSYSLKCGLAWVNMVCAAGAVGTFVIHNMVCVPYLYSLFGLFEWTFVLTNIMFHTTLVLEVGSGEQGWILQVCPNWDSATNSKEH